MSTPCKSCPWRVDNTAAQIPGYNPAAAERLAETTCGPEDGFRQIMACHLSPPESTVPCRGYLANDGIANLNVRWLVGRGEIESPGAVAADCAKAGIILHHTYAEVLEKLRRTEAL